LPEVTLHKFQLEAIQSAKRIVALVAGKQGGKTFCGSLWARLKASQFTDRKDCGIVTAPTYKILKQATLPRFLETFAGLGKWRESDSIFEMYGGQPIYIRALNNVNTIEGIPRCRWVWPDEAGQYKQMAWDNIQGRAAPMEAQMFLTTTPYALNWLYKDLYKPWMAGRRHDVHFVQFRSVDNPHFPKAEYERLKSIMDARVFAMHFEGQFQKMAGLVFMDFDEILNMDEPFVPSKRDYFIGAGVDWGYTNAYAIVVRAIHRTIPGRDYQIAEFFQSFMTPSEKVTVAKQLRDKFGIEQFYCDNEEPAMIKEFNNAGLSAVAAPKYPGSLKDNIARHNALIKTRDYKVFRGRCPYTLDEYATYHYPEMDGDEENPSELPVDANNHGCSANMYFTQCTEHIRDAARKALEFKPGKSRLERLLAGEFSQTGNKVDDWYENGNSASYE
jgi:PBSX family phage terminase large subunit